VIGAGGARESGVEPWETLLGRASTRFECVETGPTILR
jgi:hypothetical protein